MIIEQLKNKWILTFGEEAERQSSWQSIQQVGGIILTPPNPLPFPTDEAFARFKPDIGLYHVWSRSTLDKVLALSPQNVSKLVVRVRDSGVHHDTDLKNILVAQGVNIVEGFDKADVSYVSMLYVALLRATTNSTT